MTLTRLLQSASVEAAIKGSLPTGSLGKAAGGGLRGVCAGDGDNLEGGGAEDTPKGEVDAGHSWERLKRTDSRDGETLELGAQQAGAAWLVTVTASPVGRLRCGGCLHPGRCPGGPGRCPHT